MGSQGTARTKDRRHKVHQRPKGRGSSPTGRLKGQAHSRHRCRCHAIFEPLKNALFHSAATLKPKQIQWSGSLACDQVVEQSQTRDQVAPGSPAGQGKA